MVAVWKWPRSISDGLFPVGLVMLVLCLVSKHLRQRWTHLTSEDLASSKAWFKNLSYLRLPPRGDV